MHAYDGCSHLNAIPLRAWTGPWVEAARISRNRHMKVEVSALRTGRLYPPGDTPGTHFCYRLSRPQGHCASRRIMSMKNRKDPTGIEPTSFPACSAVPQPTATPRAPHFSQQTATNLYTRLYPWTLCSMFGACWISDFRCGLN